ncbi:tRNA guanosine-2 -O-methyltransferase [Ceratobasidium sp. AG-Ba]|nr:tRNA guanosine-2 -O-methyltransferase [Ceratobasidium sp. AG-Ba]
MLPTTTYLIHFAVTHSEFRIPEILSVARTYGFTVGLPPENEIDTARPLMCVELEREEDAKLLAGRCILVKAVYELWAIGSSYETLHECNKANQSRWNTPWYHQARFRFNVAAYCHTIPKQRQKEVMDSFAYMGYKGKIDMADPEFVMACIEEYPDNQGSSRAKPQVDGQFMQVVFGKLIAEGTARRLITKFDVKKRLYYGNTSMESEISLLMANQTLAAPGKLVYDPFVGTGSMLYTVAHFGALVFGSDIDGRQMRGKESTPGIRRAADQYGVENRILDLCTFDVTQSPLRRGSLFDAIVTDPPCKSTHSNYGVRAGAKRLGRKDGQEMRTEPMVLLDGSLAHTHKTYVPPTKPYELSALAVDLVELARYLLVPGGQLVFFLPTVTDDYAPVDVPQLEGMELRANSLQNFGKWGRRLITMEKVTSHEYEAPKFGLLGTPDGPGGQPEEYVPAHKNFRNKYFRGFRKDEAEAERLCGEGVVPMPG